MSSLFVLHKFWVQKNLHFWFMGPFCGSVFCQGAGFAIPDQPLSDSLDFWGHFFPESAGRDNSTCIFWNHVQFYSGRKRDQLCIPKLLCSVHGNLMVNP